MATAGAVRSHPHLHQPLLYVSRLPAQTTDNELAELLRECLPIRLGLNRDEIGPDGLVEGTIEFREIVKAEKALLTLSHILCVSPYPPPFAPLPHSSDSLPRVVSGFAEDATAGEVWESLRPVSLREIRPLQRQDWLHTIDWLVEFWFEDDARRLEEQPPQLPSGYAVSIVPYNARRFNAQPASSTAPFSARPPQQAFTSAHSRSPSSINTGQPLSPLSASAPSFVPSSRSSPQKGMAAGLWSPSSTGSLDLSAITGAYSPGVGLGLNPVGSPIGLGISTFGPGQQVQPAPVAGPGSTSASGLIDPCNLFCKNLDPSLNSQDLFNAFRKFGQIVSARVMKDDMGVSKGFGFVSFQSPAEAHRAMCNMNGVQLGDKQIVVRLHEPKKFRAEKLAEQRARALVGGSGPVRGVLSPLSQYGDMPDHGDQGEIFNSTGRRGVGSIYMTSSPDSSPRMIDADDLALLTPDHRHQILAVETHRRVSGMLSVPRNDVDTVVQALLSLDIGLVEVLKSDDLLDEKVHDALALIMSSGGHGQPERQQQTSLTSSSNISRSTSPGTERERLLEAIAKIEPNGRLAAEILELVCSLGKRDRALCLFNTDFLQGKISEAKDVLALQDDDETMPPKTAASARLTATPEFPRDKAIVTPPRAHSAPIEPNAPTSPKSSAKGSSLLGLVTSSTPVSPAGTSAISDDDDGADVRSLEAAAAAIDLSKHHSPLPLMSLAEIARLSAKDALAYLREHGPALSDIVGGFDDAKSREMADFLNGLKGKQPSQQKQSLGERLFKQIRTWNPPRSIKAPSVTIELLDTEDLASLGFLLSDYPLILREKVALAANLPTWPAEAA